MATAITPVDGVFPLLPAAAAGDVELVAQLLNANADPDTGDILDADTPLAAAARGNHLPTVGLLLSFGASPYKRAEFGAGDPLQVAYRANSIECAALLSRHAKKHGRKRTKPMFGPLCHVCNVRFSCRSKLVRHQVVHSLKRPYECDVCLKTYSQISSLRKHQEKCKIKL